MSVEESCETDGKRTRTNRESYNQCHSLIEYLQDGINERPVFWNTNNVWAS